MRPPAKTAVRFSQAKRELARLDRANLDCPPVAGDLKPAPGKPMRVAMVAANRRRGIFVLKHRQLIVRHTVALRAARKRVHLGRLAH